MPELHLMVRKDVGFWGDSLSMYIYTRDVSYPNMVGIAQPIVFNWIAEGSIVPSECSIGGMKIESATRLMDSLWEAGIRPSFPMPGHDAEIALLKAHIDDLRKLLWNRIGMEAPA